MRLRRALRWLGALAAVAASVLALRGCRSLLLPRPPAPSAESLARAQRVRILRDRWGVPHVFAKTDADAAFGLAYANAEDDFATIQDVFAAARGKLGLRHASKEALLNDYYVSLVHVRRDVDASWEHLSPEVRAVLEGYAEGLNLYASLHPREADGRIFPATGKDVAAGFAHKLPFLAGMVGALAAVFERRPAAVGERLAAAAPDLPVSFPGSNAHAVHRSRSGDDVTRLNVNSHQPWEGPVTWYEAHVHSDEGWDMVGGLFPGSPFVLHGTSPRLGWAHTVNAPDLVDVYRLDMHPDGSRRYRFGERWVDLQVSDAPLELDTGFFTVTLHREVLESLHGPVIEREGAFYAIRWAGIGRGVYAAEQWFRMNKARSLDEWKDAMRVGGVPMFNTVYADRDHVFYVYNGLLPERSGDRDWRAVLPGSDPSALWGTYLRFDELPQIEDPPSGFVFSCNSSPFQATTGAGNPKRERFAPSLGIDDPMTNRALRSLELFGAPGPIDRARFLRHKWDRAYAQGAEIWPKLFEPLLARYQPADEAEARGLELLRSWRGGTDPDDPAAALAILCIRPVFYEVDVDGDGSLDKDPVSAFRRAVAFLQEHHGRLDPPLAEVQRLRRGDVELGLGGGPDVMNAVYTKKSKGKLVGIQGDSYVLVAEYGRSETRVSSIHQYGASCRPGSRHFADQAPLFAAQELKSVPMTEAAIRAELEREYHPGE